MKESNEFNNGNKKENNNKYWYFPFFSAKFPTQKVRSSVGNIWWSLSVIALVFIWSLQAVKEKNWLFLLLGIGAGVAAEFFLIRDFVRTRKAEKKEEKTWANENKKENDKK